MNLCLEKRSVICTYSEKVSHVHVQYVNLCLEKCTENHSWNIGNFQALLKWATQFTMFHHAKLEASTFCTVLFDEVT